MMFTSRHVLIGLPLVGLLLTGCSTAPPVKTGSMESVKGIDATAREIQVLLYQYAAHFAGQVDLAANEIYYGSRDYEVRMAALQWSANAVPEMMKSCFHFDPLAGLLGAGAFAVQMNDFFTTGNGKDLFGEYQHVAVETSTRLRKDLLELSQKIWPDGDFEPYRQKVAAWAGDHPIANTRFVRGEFDYETVLRTGTSQDMGLRLAGSMNAQLLALTDRANVMMALLPRQVHWEKEMMMDETKQMVEDMADSTIAQAMGTLGPVLEFIAEQRALTVRDLAHERAMVFEAIAGERNSVLEAIADERNATMQDISGLTLTTLDRVATTSQSVMTESVDQIFDRVTRMLAIPFIALGLFVIGIMIWVRNTVNRVLARK